MLRAVGMLGCLALCFSSGSAAAQAASPSAQPKLSVGDEVARGLFQAGKAAYEAGSYQEAIGFFEQAYARSGRPQLLFNIGQVADRLRQDEKALSSFRAYLEQVPDAGNRVEVEARIAALERAEAERKAATAAAPPAAPPTPAQTAVQSPEAQPAADPAFTQTDQAPSTPVTKKWWFWTSIGVVVAGGTAVALAVALNGDDGGSETPYQGTAGSFKGP